MSAYREAQTTRLTCTEPRPTEAIVVSTAVMARSSNFRLQRVVGQKLSYVPSQTGMMAQHLSPVLSSIPLGIYTGQPAGPIQALDRCSSCHPVPVVGLKVLFIHLA